MLRGHHYSVLRDRAVFIGDCKKYPLVQNNEYFVSICVGEGDMILSRPYIEVCWEENGAGCIPYRSIKDMLKDWRFS